jgi:hypothetical protein
MQEFEDRKEPMNLTLAFPALTGDVIMDYFFGFNYGQLKHPEFESFHDAFMKVGATGHIATQFPAIFPVWLALYQLKKSNTELILDLDHEFNSPLDHRISAAIYKATVTVQAGQCA